MSRKVINNFFEMHHRCRDYFENHRVLSSHPIAFQDLWKSAYSSSELFTVPWSAHTNNSRDRKADLRCVYFRAIASNNSCLFHASHPLRHCRGREPNTLPKFAKRKPRILLKLLQNPPAGFIKKLFHF